MNRDVSSFADRSREVVAEFLHTVVVIDDEARFPGLESLVADGSPQPHTAQAIKPAPESKPADSAGNPTPDLQGPDSLKLVTPTLAQFQAAAEEEADSHDLDAKRITDGFAKQGLVCAVMRPNVGEPLELAATSAVSRADIVVMDWVLHDDNGAATLEVIKSILSTAENRLRLITIYTGQAGLRAIADRLAGLVETLTDLAPMTRPDDFTVVRGSVRIGVFAKSKTKIPDVDSELLSRVTSSDALPGLLVTEFSKLTSGLVSNVAVASLAALRQNTHSILRRLSPSLDSAYLWHRSAQVHPQEAQDHLRTIVVDELGAVLVDAGADAHADIDAIASWLAANIPTDDYKLRFGLDSDRTRADAIDLLTAGAAGKGKEAVKAKFPTFSQKAHAKTLQCFADSVANNTLANEELAMLLSLRSYYRSPAPTLTLGTIMRTGSDDQATYWLCVQPACDGVRLGDVTAFPILPLALAVGSEPFHVVVRASAALLRLKLKSKPQHIKMERFAPDPAKGGAVVAAKDDRGWWFGSATGEQYEWLAELKPQHALWFASKLIGELSRIGLVESEWLRRWCADAED